MDDAYLGGQDALRGGGLDQSREAPTQAEAGAGQGLPQARDRLQPSGNPHRVGPQARPATGQERFLKRQLSLPVSMISQ